MYKSFQKYVVISGYKTLKKPSVSIKNAFSLTRVEIQE